MRPTQWLMLAALSVLWGGTFLFIGIAVKELPVLTIVLARVGLAALILLPIVLLSGHALPRTRALWQALLGMSLLNNIIPFTLIATGQKEVASGIASVLNAATPLFTAIVVHLFADDEKLTPRRLAGVLIGMAGVAVLVGPEAMAGNRAGVIGMACLLGAALSYAFSGLWGRRFKAVPPLVSSCGQLLCSTILLAPFALAIDQPWTLAMPSDRTLLALAGLASLSTALAYLLFFRIMAVSGPSNVMLVTLLIPVSAIWLGATFLGETILARHIAGALIIGLALIVIDGRVLALLRRPAAATR